MDIDKNLIVIRGNSGSGKSTLANNLRELLKKRGLKVALLEQDYIRREILKEKDELDMVDSIELLKSMIATVSGLGYVIILEGIFWGEKYGKFLTELNRTFGNDKSIFFYYKINFEETLNRHSTKSNSHEFGETELRSWWKDDDSLGFTNEYILDSSGLECVLKDVIELVRIA
jgi:deoxyadenosine/deoxycytidine kinase